MSYQETGKYLDVQGCLNPDESANIMTEGGYTFLKSSLEEAEIKLKEAKKSVGEAGDTSDWHDNFALDEAHRQVDFWTAMINLKRSQLKDAILIKPREETDRVGLGNAVELRFNGGKDVETFLVLGPVDSTFRENCMSYKTPIGRMILGQPVGKTIEFEVDRQKTGVKIVKILPGNF